MTAIKCTIVSTGSGTCALSGKESSDGLTVSFDDGTVANQFLSWKAFQQLLRMKAGVPAAPAQTVAAPKPAPVAAAVPAGNGAK